MFSKPFNYLINDIKKKSLRNNVHKENKKMELKTNQYNKTAKTE